MAKIYYNGIFYATELRSEYEANGQWPRNGVEISEEEYRSLMEIRSKGGTIVSDASGKPIGTPRPGPTITEVKSYMWARIKQKRDDLTENGGFSVIGKWFHSDQKSRNQQLGLVLLGNNIPVGLQWKTMDGSYIDMTPSLARQILQSAAENDTAIFKIAETHKINMEASDDPASYDFSIGWPQSFK